MKHVYGAVLLASVLLITGCNKETTTTITDETSLQITGATTSTSTTTTTTTQVTIPESFLSYSNSWDKLAIRYPSGRTMQETAFNSIVMFFTPMNDGDTFKENAGITKEALQENMTLDAYYANAKELLSGAITDFQEISVADATISNLPAKKIVFAGKQDTYSIQWQQYVVIKDKNVYVFTYTALNDTFNKYLADIDLMAQSLTFE